MPTYDYQCRSCGHTIEVIHSMREAGPSACDRCGGELRRILYPAGIIFKGSGFYKTDSRASASGGSTAAAAASKAKPEGDGASGDGSSAASAPTAAESSKAETSKAESPKAESPKAESPKGG